MLTIQNLTKHYKGSHKGVTNLTLEIKAGDIYGFIGHNGAGKTTTIKWIAYIPDNPDFIISALVHKPKLLILDEPFVGLDPKASVVLKEIMHQICEEGGAIFFSTHVLDVAEKLCNKVAIIKDGKLIASGDMDKMVTEGTTLESIFMEVVSDDKAD